MSVISETTLELSGIPTTKGKYNFTVTVTDDSDGSVSQAFSVTISEPSKPDDPEEPIDPIQSNSGSSGGGSGGGGCNTGIALLGLLASALIFRFRKSA